MDVLLHHRGRVTWHRHSCQRLCQWLPTMLSHRKKPGCSTVFIYPSGSRGSLNIPIIIENGKSLTRPRTHSRIFDGCAVWFYPGKPYPAHQDQVSLSFFSQHTPHTVLHGPRNAAWFSWWSSWWELTSLRGSKEHGVTETRKTTPYWGEGGKLRTLSD